MKWLTFEQIKSQLRLDDVQAAAERDLLELYGESAEETVLSLIRRSEGNVLKTWGCIPKRLVHASLLLVDVSYKERSPISPVNMYLVGYSFDLLLKPFMRLSGDEDDGGGDDVPVGALMDCDGVLLEDAVGLVLCGAA